MISELVKRYEEYQEKKLMNIAAAAIVAEANLLKGMKEIDPESKEQFFQNALDDLRLIKDELTKSDFTLEEMK